MSSGDGGAFTVKPESLEGLLSDFEKHRSCLGTTTRPGEGCQISFSFDPATPSASGTCHASFSVETDTGRVLVVALQGNSDATVAAAHRQPAARQHRLVLIPIG